MLNMKETAWYVDVWVWELKLILELKRDMEKSDKKRIFIPAFNSRWIIDSRK